MIKGQFVCIIIICILGIYSFLSKELLAKKLDNKSVTHGEIKYCSTYTNPFALCPEYQQDKEVIVSSAVKEVAVEKSTVIGKEPKSKNKKTASIPNKKKISKKIIAKNNVPEKNKPIAKPHAENSRQSSQMQADDSEKTSIVIVNNFNEDKNFLSFVKGLLLKQNKKLEIFDTSNENETKEVLYQAYKLLRMVTYWDKNTILITSSKNIAPESTLIVAKTKTSHYIVTQDSGVLTLVMDLIGVEEIRLLQRANFKTETFYPYDVEYQVAARIANNKNNFNSMGEKISSAKVKKIKYEPATNINGTIYGEFLFETLNNTIITFIQSRKFNYYKPNIGDNYSVVIYDNNKEIFRGQATYKPSLTYTGNDPIISETKSGTNSYIIIKNFTVKGLLPNKLYTIELNPIKNAAADNTIDEEVDPLLEKNEEYLIDEKTVEQQSVTEDKNLSPSETIKENEVLDNKESVEKKQSLSTSETLMESNQNESTIPALESSKVSIVDEESDRSNETSSSPNNVLTTATVDENTEDSESMDEIEERKLSNPISEKYID